MPRCCRGDLPPKIEDGRHIRSEGSGTPQDPLIINATTLLEAVDNAIFNVVLDGDGTLESPWRLQVIWNGSAQLTDMPDVFAENPPNGYVLTWNTSSGRWQAGPPSQVSPGAILHGNGITGDGSVGGPLTAVGNSSRFVGVTAGGIGLTDTGVNALIRPFSNTTTRAAASPAPVEGALSILATRPDVIDRWDGTTWVPVTGGRNVDIQTGQLLSLSGAYSGGSTTTYLAQLAATTDATGAFVVIPNADLSGYSGVIACDVQEMGNIPWHCQVKAGVNNITGVAYRLDTGAPYASVALTGTVRATLY